MSDDCALCMILTTIGILLVWSTLPKSRLQRRLDELRKERF